MTARIIRTNAPVQIVECLSLELSEPTGQLTAWSRKPNGEWTAAKVYLDGVQRVEVSAFERPQKQAS